MTRNKREEGHQGRVGISWRKAFQGMNREKKDQKVSLLEIQIALRESHPATSGQATGNTASNE